MEKDTYVEITDAEGLITQDYLGCRGVVKHVHPLSEAVEGATCVVAIDLGEPRNELGGLVCCRPDQLKEVS